MKKKLPARLPAKAVIAEWTTLFKKLMALYRRQAADYRRQAADIQATRLELLKISARLAAVEAALKSSIVLPVNEKEVL